MWDIARYRRPFIVLFELALVALCNYAAFLIRFDGNIPPVYLDLLTLTLPFLIFIRAVIFAPFRLYEGLWRYTSLWDLRNISAAIFISSAVSQLVFNTYGTLGYPRSIIVTDTLLLICAMTGIRLSRRIVQEVMQTEHDNGVLVYGAGDAGAMIVREMKANPQLEKHPIGFIDDDRKMKGLRIHGIPVLGTTADLQAIMDRKKVTEVLIAMPNASAQELRNVVTALSPFKIPISTLPNIRDLLGGKVTVSQIRSLALEDLLHRDPVGLDAAPVKNLIAGRCVLVTGAGGSIGSELCRQIAAMKPNTLVMVEQHEPSIYTIHKDLVRSFSGNLVARLADITNRDTIRGIMSEFKPQIVFHAAAYKHVPLMEGNPCAAVRNNVAGTRIVAEETAAAGAERFILISTDKAVNPASIMGVSKRVAEFLVQSLAEKNSTCFNVVRFGNVLGSSGSVVPLFLEQIRAGGPVTVTHPEMRRYFMLIPEAVQLVLHAAALGNSGAIYVLDMGEEFKVIDLAKNMIRLSGLVPDEDIHIEFVGLRPGEKLFETLVGIEETLEPAKIDKVSIVVSSASMDRKSLEAYVLELEQSAVEGKIEDVLRLLKKIVPTYTR